MESIAFFRPTARGPIKKTGIKVVHTVHDVEPLYEGAADMSGLGLVYQNCDALIVHTEANRRDLLDAIPPSTSTRFMSFPTDPFRQKILRPARRVNPLGAFSGFRKCAGGAQLWEHQAL